MTKSSYTTQLQAGLGLIPETQRLLDLWSAGMSRSDLLTAALASGEFPNVTARRLRNVVTEAFAPRYLIEEALPARVLQVLNGKIPTADLKQLFFIYTCRANRILADYVREVYWDKYSAGSSVVSKADSLAFVERAICDGMTTTRWSASTITRIASYLLGASADFDLLGPMKKGARQIHPLRPSPLVSSFLAHDLHFKGLGDNALMGHEDWRLLGLSPEDVLEELKRLALRGEIIVQSAGSVVHIAWKHEDMKEVANGFVDS